ncbi:putative lipid II flippase FtsW [Rothia uropygialis]|uniref:putative lipid II flippase FtsW n=1 Tax=Kocuria sp. 36 TaxID=1415402 RepID=UPI00101C9664|nr:putative lipid II flippase FtsW [Kocuria sp. 36]
MSTPAPGRPQTRRKDTLWTRVAEGYRYVTRPLYRWVATGSMSSASIGIAVSSIGLTVLGCMMVLSASSVEQLSRGLSPYGLFLRQGIFALGGIVAMFVASRIKISFWKNQRLTYWLMGISLVLLLLVLSPMGKEVNGNQNWLAVGAFSFQPSEIAKFSLMLWVVWSLVKSTRVSESAHDALLPSCLGFLAVAGLVIIGGDAGTCIVFVLIYASALWFARAPRKIFTRSFLIGLVVMVLVVIARPHRLSRVITWLVPSTCTQGQECYQANSGMAALATGSWWGEGLGQSRQKYSYLPEAHNDFIIAILGEELGFIGTCVVVALFVVLALCLARIILRSTDRFVRLAAGCILAWFIGQAFVNIGMVTGLLPVIGVPLPFVSYGGTSLMMSLFTSGFAMSLAKAPTHPAISLKSLDDENADVN